MFLLAAGTAAEVFIGAADLQGKVKLGWNDVNRRRYLLFRLISLLDPSTMTWYWSKPSAFTMVPLLSQRRGGKS